MDLHIDCLRQIFLLIADDFRNFHALALSSKGLWGISKQHVLYQNIFSYLMEIFEGMHKSEANVQSLDYNGTIDILGFIEHYRDFPDFKPIVHELPVKELISWMQSERTQTLASRRILSMVASEIAEEHEYASIDDLEWITKSFQDLGILPQPFESNGVSQTILKFLSTARAIYNDRKLYNSLKKTFGHRLPILVAGPMIQLAAAILFCISPFFFP